MEKREEREKREKREKTEKREKSLCGLLHPDKHGSDKEPGGNVGYRVWDGDAGCGIGIQNAECRVRDADSIGAG